MRKAIFLLFLLMLTPNVEANVYKYKDKSGKVYFVDSVYQIPKEYLANAEVLPSGKELNKVEKRILARMNSENLKIGDMFFFDLTNKLKMWIGGYLFIFLILFLYFNFKRDYLSVFSVILFFFLVWQGIYIFKIYPETRETVLVYSYLTKKIYDKKLSVAERVKKTSLEHAVLNRPLPLNPYSFYKKVLKIRDFYNYLSQGELLE